MKEKTVEKLLSGRLWLTAIGGIVFAYCAYRKMLEPAAISAILMMIFQAYFQRQDRSNGKPNPMDKTSSP